MMNEISLQSVDRRTFIKVSGATCGALIIHLALPKVALGDQSTEAVYKANAWLRIDRMKTTFILDRAEMGQGVLTALAMILGEELDFDPTRFEFEFAPCDKAYTNADLGLQVTGGSTSVHSSWLPLRHAGAQARSMILAAAAKEWNVPTSELETQNGTVFHKRLHKSATYNELAALASSLNAVPYSLKSQPNTYVGHSFSRLENKIKISGQAAFGIDTMPKDALHAFILRPPIHGASVKTFKMPKMPSDQIVIETISTGLAILSNSYFNSKSLAQSIEVEWNLEDVPKPDSKTIDKELSEALQHSGRGAKDVGEVDSFLTSSTNTRIFAEYNIPFLAHATMEPQNCCASVSEDECVVWAPTQSATLARRAAALASGLSEDKVTIHTTFLGGGFGRRLAQDYISEAVELSRKVKKTVQITWSREDDIKHGIYRPISKHKCEGAILKDKGEISAWRHHIASPSILPEIIGEWVIAAVPSWLPEFVINGVAGVGRYFYRHSKVDETSVEGADSISYQIPNICVEHSHIETHVPLGFWRSVGHFSNAFVVESFFNELAASLEVDPYTLRKKYLPKDSRERKVLDAVAERAGWENKVDGLFYGIAQHASFRSFSACVALVERAANETLKIRKIIIGIDCGLVINPDMIHAQLESSVIFALSAALKGKITWTDGSVDQNNFYDYPLLRTNEIPEIDTLIISSEEAPTGVGEPGVPPVAPALGGAIFAATGKQLRDLPFAIGWA